MAQAQRSPKAQQEIPGAEAPSIPELDELAVPLVKSIAQRDKLKEKISELREATMQRMELLGVPVYRFEDGKIRSTFKITEKKRLSITTEEGAAE